MQLNNNISFRYETVMIFKEQGKQTSMSYNPAQSNICQTNTPTWFY